MCSKLHARLSINFYQEMCFAFHVMFQGCITGIYARIRTHDLLITRCYYGCSSLCKLTSKSSPDFKTLLQLNWFFGPSHLPSLTKNLNLGPSLQVQARARYAVPVSQPFPFFLQLFEETMKKVLAEKMNFHRMKKFFGIRSRYHVRVRVRVGALTAPGSRPFTYNDT